MVSNRSVTTAIGALCMVQFIDVLGVTVVVSALPRMLASLSAPASSGGLIATGYAMFFGGLLMFGARLGDRIGHRRTILVSLVVFAAGAVLGAIATTLVVLVIARCVQGAAAASAVPSALRLLTTIAPDEQVHRRAVAAWSAAGAAAGASGFVVGGLVTQFASWRAIFWGYLPLSVLLGVAILRSVPSDGRGDALRRLEAPGSLLLTGAVMAIVLGATVLPDHLLTGAGLLLVALVAGGLFARVDQRSSQPLLPMLRGAPLRLGAGGSFVNTATTSSTATLVTLYWQDTLGRSALTTAAALLPFSLAAVAGAMLAARLMRRWSRPLVAAVGLATIGICLVLLSALAGNVGWMAACLVPTGVGLSLSSVASTSLGTSVAEDIRASAAGLINTAAQVGTAVGIAAFVLLAAATTGVPAVGTGPPRVAWLGAAAVALLASAWFARSATSGQVLRGPNPPGPTTA